MPSPDANQLALTEIGLMYEQAVGVIVEALVELTDCDRFHRADPVARAILARLASAEPPILLSRE